VPIYKKVDKTDCNNYQGTSLLSSAYKLLSNILLARLTPYVSEIIGDHSVQTLFLSSHLISKRLKIKYTELILPFVLYGCKTWSLTLREEHRLRVFEISVLRKVFGPKREEDRSWRTLHNDELHSLYSSLNIVRVSKPRSMRGAGHVACMGEGRGVYRVLVWRLKGRRPLGRPRHR
jgi:hypothetical protein